MLDVLAFWVVGLILAVAVLPIAFWLFRTFPDGGAGLAFGLGSILVGYSYFILRVLGVLEAGRGGVFVALVVVASASAVVASRDRRFLTTLRRVAPELLLVAGLFSVMFLSYTAFRSYSADITGTEKPMDFMYLNAAITSPEYPPHDPWLAGEPASYYYFGYVQTGVVTQLSGVPSSTGYNLMLGFIFAASATAAASIAAALARRVATRMRQRASIIAAVLAVVFLLFLGTLSGPFEWAAAHGNTNEGLYEAFGLETLLSCGPDDAPGSCYSGAEPRTNAWYPTEFWFWWDGSRVIPGTITEFPFFSFLLGDLHPHVMAIPGTLLVVALAFSVLVRPGALSFANHRRNPLPGVLYAILLGALAFTNTWDLITFVGLFAIAVLLRNVRARGNLLGLRATAAYIAPIAVIAALAFAPWYVDFRSQASGLEPYVGTGIRPAHFLLQFGLLALLGAAVSAFSLTHRLRGPFIAAAPYTIWIALIPLLGWALLPSSFVVEILPDGTEMTAGLSERVNRRGAGGWVTLALLFILTWMTVTVFVAAWLARHPLAPVAGLAAGGLLLIFGGELFLIKDVFFGGLPRLNTVFKLTYQAWILLSVAGAVSTVAIADRLRPSAFAKAAFVAPVAILVSLGLVYALIAVPNKAGGFGGEPDIDGLAFLARSDPGEFAMLSWLSANLDRGSVVVEATGRTWGASDGAPMLLNVGVDYGPGGRISARTGLQTPIGWFSHEDQWRGSTPEWRAEFSRRQDLVDQLYTGRGDVVSILRELNASYIVVGGLELLRYPAGNIPDFSQTLDLVFEQGDARVYALPQLSLRGGE